MWYDVLEEKIEMLTGTNLIYPYSLSGKDREDFIFHEHSWHYLMSVIFKEYKIFSIEGYEEYYSKQEIDIINKLVKSLNEKEDKKNVKP